jgi:transcriptional regulator GlxA family with amidase domain
MLQQNMDTPPPVADVAAHLQVSRRKLERHFAASLSLSPSEAFMRVRLSQVRMLLARPDRTVSQIAAETGFCDASHLIRVFREGMGMTPEQWRKGAREEASLQAAAGGPA